jgi:hypothetical protein
VIGRYRDLTDAKKVMTYFYILMIKSLPEPTNADLAARDLRESQPSKSAIEPVRHAESISDPKAVDSTTKQVLSSYGMTPHRILPEGGEGGSRFGMSVTER